MLHKLSSNYVIDLDSKHLLVLDSKLASKVNKLLDRYPNGTRFKSGDEVVFKIDELSRKRLLKLLGINKGSSN